MVNNAALVIGVIQFVQSFSYKLADWILVAFNIKHCIAYTLLLMYNYLVHIVYKYGILIDLTNFKKLTI